MIPEGRQILAVLALCCAATTTDAQDRSADEDRFMEGERPSLEGERQAQPIAADDWLPLEEALHTAGRVQHPVFVYVRAPWCGPCYRLEREVFPRIEGELGFFIKARVDLSEMPDPGYPKPDFDWIRRHGLDVPPSFALLGPNGDLLATVTGFLGAPELRHLLQLAKEEAFRTSLRGRDDGSNSPTDISAKDDPRK